MKGELEPISIVMLTFQVKFMKNGMFHYQFAKRPLLHLLFKPQFRKKGGGLLNARFSFKLTRLSSFSTAIFSPHIFITYRIASSCVGMLISAQFRGLSKTAKINSAKLYSGLNVFKY